MRAGAGALRGAASGRGQARAAGAGGTARAGMGGPGAVHGGARQRGMERRPAAMASRLLVAAQEAVREDAQAVLAGAEHGGAELGEDLFGQIGVGQQPGRAAQRREEAEAPGQRHALHAEQAPGAAEGAADPALQAAEDGDAGAVRRRPALRGAWSRGPGVAQRRNWRETVSGLPKRSGRAAQGGGARPGRVWAASQKMASRRARGSRTGRPAGRRLAEGWRVGVLGGLDARPRAASPSRLRRRGRRRGRGRPIRCRRAVPSSVRGSSGGGGRSGSWRWAPRPAKRGNIT